MMPHFRKAVPNGPGRLRYALELGAKICRAMAHPALRRKTRILLEAHAKMFDQLLAATEKAKAKSNKKEKKDGDQS